MTEDRIRRINIPIPNPALAEWLMGPECRAKVEEVTSEIFAIYQNALPVGRDSRHPGLLKGGASFHVGPGGFGDKQDRWFGYIENSAPYGAAIEYGRRRYNPFPGQHQLQQAAEVVSGQLGSVEGIELPGIHREEHGRGSKLKSRATGRYVANPITARRRRKP